MKKYFWPCTISAFLGVGAGALLCHYYIYKWDACIGCASAPFLTVGTTVLFIVIGLFLIYIGASQQSRVDALMDHFKSSIDGNLVFFRSSLVESLEGAAKKADHFKSHFDNAFRVADAAKSRAEDTRQALKDLVMYSCYRTAYGRLQKGESTEKVKSYIASQSEELKNVDGDPYSARMRAWKQLYQQKSAFESLLGRVRAGSLKPHGLMRCNKCTSAVKCHSCGVDLLKGDIYYE